MTTNSRTMAVTIKVLVAFVLWWFATSAALEYGGIWDSHVNPNRGITVTLQGRAVTGTLSRDWDKLWSLTTDDGAVVKFSDFQMMSAHVPNTQSDDSIVLMHWRRILPLGVVSGLLICYLLSQFWWRPGKWLGTCRSPAHDR